MPYLGGCITTPSLQNDMVWLGTKNEDFSIQSFYFPLASRRAEPFPHSIVQNSQVPVRTSFFAWKATWAKILIKDQLRRRGWRMSNRCYMCKAREEAEDHILLHCPKASILWQLVFALFHVQWVMHSFVRGVLLSWNSFSVGKKRKKAWKVGPLCIFWSIWRERNRRTFEDRERLDQTIKSFFFSLLGLG